MKNLLAETNMELEFGIGVKTGVVVVVGGEWWRPELMVKWLVQRPEMKLLLEMNGAVKIHLHPQSKLR
jgi:hypothetical protein